MKLKVDGIKRIGFGLSGYAHMTIEVELTEKQHMDMFFLLWEVNGDKWLAEMLAYEGYGLTALKPAPEPARKGPRHD